MNRVSKIFVYLALGGLTIITLFPFLWMMFTSLKSPKTIGVNTFSLSLHTFTLDNYIYVVTQTSVPRYLLNSFYIALIVAICGTLISIFSGYALSRFQFKGKKLFIHCLMFTRMFPWILAMVPIYIIMYHIQLVNTHFSLIIMYIVAVIPFDTLMCSTYFSTVPRDLEDAARIDGCSQIGLIFRILIPIVTPGIVAVMVYSVIVALQEFVLALILLSDRLLFTLPLGLYMFIGAHGEVAWGPMMAATTFLTIPLVLAFTYFQKFIIRGLGAGAVKG